jgi:hypothetical protein
MRVTFCNGRSVDLKPLNATQPYYFGLEYDGKLGEPATQALVHGKVQDRAIGTCPPPSRVTRGEARSARDHGVAFTSLGPADCTAVQRPGDAILLAVTVQGGHTICVTGRDNNSTSFLDGTQRATSSHVSQPPVGTSPTLSDLGVDDRGRPIVLGTLLDNVDQLRLTFCDGRRLTLRPLNDTPPRFVAAVLGLGGDPPSTLMLDGDVPAGFTRNTCAPPTTSK